MSVEEWYKAVSSPLTARRPQFPLPHLLPLCCCHYTTATHSHADLRNPCLSDNSRLRTGGGLRSCRVQRVSQMGSGPKPTPPLLPPQIITPFHVYFNAKLIFTKYELWRLLSNFFFFGNLGLYPSLCLHSWPAYYAGCSVKSACCTRGQGWISSSTCSS